MEIIYSDEAQLDIKYWKKSGNKIIQKRFRNYLTPLRKLRSKTLASLNN